MTLRTELMQQIQAAGFSIPIAWPGVNFTPPASGTWIEVTLFENEPLQPGLASDAVVHQVGILQINVTNRPGQGFVGIEATANQVIAAFPKGTRIGVHGKVTRTPYKQSGITEGDKIMIPVRIEYGP